MKPILAIFFALAVSSPLALADSKDSDQQDKDLKNKQQIYGVKYPWQNTQPYGTQYTPPPGGAEPAQSSDEPAKAAAPKPDKPGAKPKSAKAKAAAKAKAVKTSAKNARAAANTAAKHALPKGAKHPIL